MIKIDDWWEMLIVGLIILAALGAVLVFLRWFLRRGGKIKGPGFEAIEGPESPACAPYVAEHTAILQRVEARLEKMDEDRHLAREGAIETEKAMQKMIKKIMVSQDAVMDALQSANIGNGNLKKARDALAECGDVRDEYLIDQIAVRG